MKKYIAIEGVKGSGKSTLINGVMDILNSAEVKTTLIAPTRPAEPVSIMEKITNFYPKLRECDLWNEMLYANRSNRQGLKAAKAEGILIGDRSIVTSYATRWNKWPSRKYCIERVDKLEPILPPPSHIIYLDVKPETALARIGGRRDRNYGQNDETPARINEALKAYKEIMNYNIRRIAATEWIKVDANGTFEDILYNTIYIVKTVLNLRLNDYKAARPPQQAVFKTA